MSKIFNLSPYCKEKPKKEEAPHNMYGIYYDLDGWRVATNGYVLAATKNGYDPEMAEKIITSKGEELEGRYPNWRAVIPSEVYCQQKIKIDIKEIEGAIKDFKLRKKLKKIFYNITDCKIKIGEQIFYGSQLGLFVNHMKFAKADIIICFGDTRCIIFKDDNNIGIVMPLTCYEMSDDPEDRLCMGEYEMKNIKITRM